MPLAGSAGCSEPCPGGHRRSPGGARALYRGGSVLREMVAVGETRRPELERLTGRSWRAASTGAACSTPIHGTRTPSTPSGTATSMRRSSCTATSAPRTRAPTYGGSSMPRCRPTNSPRARRHPRRHSSFFGEGEIGPIDYLRRRVRLPVRPEFPPEDPEYGGRFVVTLDADGRPDPDGPRREVHAPRFLIQDGRPRDEPWPADPRVRRRVDRPGPRIRSNLAATLTICTGVFSRGTYGAVRALTDVNLRSRNEKYLVEHVSIPNEFWLLMHVPVFGGVAGAQTPAPRTFRVRSIASEPHP